MVLYLIQGLDVEPSRREFVKEMQKLIPSAVFEKCVNGLDVEETKRAFVESGIASNMITRSIRKYGAISCFLSKLRALKHQIDTGIDFMCLLEDDCVLDPTFESVVNTVGIPALEKDDRYNYVTFHRWSGGYLFSLASAKRLYAALMQQGIVTNIDLQIEKMGGGRFDLSRRGLIKEGIKAGTGQLHRTQTFENQFTA